MTMRKFLWCLGFMMFVTGIFAARQIKAQEAVSPESQVGEVKTEQAEVKPESYVGLSIPQVAEKLIREEIEFLGAFEVEDLESGDIRRLSLDHVTEEITTVSDDESAVRTVFKDEGGNSYDVNVYILKFGENDYEIVDAVFVKDESTPEVEG